LSVLRHTTNKGIIFSIDVLFASLIFLMMLLLLVNSVSSNFSAENFSGEEKIIFASALSESIVKSRDENAPWRGCAYYDLSKKRVLANVIDLSLLGNMAPEKVGDFQLFGLYRKQGNSKSFFFGSEKENCVIIERLVFFRGVIEEKGILGVVVCES